MEAKTKYAEIAVVTNPNNGEVTLYVSNEPWGPVVTGKNLAEAKAKMNEAFGLTMIANSYCATININSDDTIKEKIVEYKQELAKMTKTLEYSL